MKIPIAGGTPVVLTKATNPFGMSWTTDNTIVFAQPEGIMRVSANGGTAEVLVATKAGEEQIDGPQALPGGEWLLFSTVRGQAFESLPCRLRRSRAQASGGGQICRVTADGSRISRASRQTDVYVLPFPGVDSGRWQVSTGGGSQPKWAANSRELFYVDLEGRIVVVPIGAGAGFVAGNPQVVIDGPYATVIPGFAGRM